MICSSLASCGDKKNKKSKSESTAETTSAAVETTTENPHVKIEGNKIDIIAEEDTNASGQPTTKDENAPVFDNAVEAGSGDAFLALNCNDWWIQYWGDSSDPLSYNAGIETIDGNGQYTVSLTADTDGFRYAMNQDAAEPFTPDSVGLAAVMIKDGASVCPDAVITIDSITVNGNPIELKKKNYTNKESGNIRANIYNEWVSDENLPADAKVMDGALYENGSKSALYDGSYSAVIADKSSFDNWMNISVTFTVSGLDHDKPVVYEEYSEQW